MDTTIQMEEEVFDAVRKLTGEAERRVFLDQACANNPALRARIERLLVVQASAEKIFSRCAPDMRSEVGAFASLLADGSPAEAAGAPLPAEEQLGAKIGHYKLLQKIGEGGCGVVYMAEQEEPVRRQVAFKIIKLGMDTRSVIARFEAERQALAMMDHPNIAWVLDAGATETGRPYFVMELVRGIRITDYCDQNQLDTRQRLSLFIQICHAIQHAHQKGIIHRDIKPSNILVTLHDGVPVPKVIDFGIAKAMQERLTDKTPFTFCQQIIGTPAYMSPEQAEMRRLDIDTRSDIYSLGVLLYELLTGKTPFDQKELLQCGLDEMRRTLREKEPPRPSAKLNTLHGAELTQTAIHRHVEPPKLKSLLRGDLDWIVMKALEKDRARRYETADGLAMDIERYLDNEPVMARPPSRLYQFQKLVHRNKTVFAAVAAVTAALVIGLGASTLLFFKEREARQRALAARQEAELARNNEAKLRFEAEVREKITQAALLVSQDRCDKADELMSKVTLSQPTLEGAAVLRSLGEWHALQHQPRWKQAAERFTALLQINQLDGWDIATLDFLGCGTALAELKDVEGYEQCRRKAVARFANTTNSVVAERMLKISLLLPAEENFIGKLSSLVDLAMSKLPVSISAQTPADVVWRQTPSGSISVETANTPPMPTPSNNGFLALIGVCSFDGASIGMEFNGLVDTASATNQANYSVAGTTLTNVTMGPDGKSVVLWLSSRLTGEFVVTVNDVRDLSQNTIASGSTIRTSVLNLHLRDFDTGQPFSVSYAGNVATIEAGGEDIWRTTDQFGFAYTTVAGDFDYCLKIHSIEPTQKNFTRVGLMARDSLNDAGCREVTVGFNAEKTFQVLVRAVAGGDTTSLPPNPLPVAAGSNLWVRLQRVGTVFHAYSSTNGTDWAQLYQFDSTIGAEGPFADPIYLGIATCAYSSTETAKAVVSDFTVTPIVPANTAISLGLLEYRRGGYAKAVEWSRRCLAHPDYNPARFATAQFILAMSLRQLGDVQGARFQLAQGRNLIERKFEGGLDLGGTAQGFWFDWVYARILLREATTLIEGTPQSVSLSAGVK